MLVCYVYIRCKNGVIIVDSFTNPFEHQHYHQQFFIDKLVHVSRIVRSLLDLRVSHHHVTKQMVRAG